MNLKPYFLRRLSSIVGVLALCLTAYPVQASWVPSFTTTNQFGYSVNLAVQGGWMAQIPLIAGLPYSYQTLEICYADFSDGYHMGWTPDLTSGCTAGVKGLAEHSSQQVVGWGSDWGQPGVAPFLPTVATGYAGRPLTPCAYPDDSNSEFANEIDYLSTSSSQGSCVTDPPEGYLPPGTWYLTTPFDGVGGIYDTWTVGLAPQGGATGTTDPSHWPNVAGAFQLTEVTGGIGAVPPDAMAPGISGQGVGAPLPVYICTAAWEGNYVTGYAVNYGQGYVPSNGCFIVDPQTHTQHLVNPFYVAEPFWVYTSGAEIHPPIPQSNSMAWANPLGLWTFGSTKYLCRAYSMFSDGAYQYYGEFPGEVDQTNGLCSFAIGEFQMYSAAYQVMSYGYMNSKPD